MKLEKVQFCEYVNKYKKMLEEEEGITDALNIDWDWVPSTWIENYYKILSDLCELPKDKVGGSLLDWFVYDTNFGKEDNLILCGDKKWRINSPEILYDFIEEKLKKS